MQRKLCECGCGKPAPVATATRRERGYAKGQALRFLPGHNAVTHGGSSTPEYRAWWAAHQRCENPSTKQYADYGGRGIRVCAQWGKFEKFLADMGPRPTALHSLDRIRNSRGYSRSNCRWATRAEQQRNTRANIWYKHRGRLALVADLARRYGFANVQTLRYRLQAGWAMARALRAPVRARAAA